MLSDLVKAQSGKRGFTYTHKPMDSAHNREAVKAANEGGFTVNLSANNLAHADTLSALGIAPVVVVLPIDSPAKVQTPAGRKVIVCPAQQRNNVTCETCGLCQKSARSVIVGFRAHGSSRKLVEAIASN
jgi:hypothetical protein